MGAQHTYFEHFQVVGYRQLFAAAWPPPSICIRPNDRRESVLPTIGTHEHAL